MFQRESHILTPHFIFMLQTIHSLESYRKIYESNPLLNPENQTIIVSKPVKTAKMVYIGLLYKHYNIMSFIIYLYDYFIVLTTLLT